jgi:bifunctional non-homologous end joining protein LigD
VPAPTLEPMLAGYGAPSGPLDRWAVEPKLDGWRALVTVADGTASVTSRRGRPLAVPELAPLASVGLDVVLDGELVAAGGRMSDFYEVAPRLARRHRSTTLQFAAFDVLWLDGHLLTHLSYDDRRRLLCQLDLPHPACVVPSWPGADAPSLLEACEVEGVEGVVLKRRDAGCTPGRRSTMWRKVKCDAWRMEHAARRRPRY